MSTSSCMLMQRMSTSSCMLMQRMSTSSCMLMQRMSTSSCMLTQRVAVAIFWAHASKPNCVTMQQTPMDVHDRACGCIKLSLKDRRAGAETLTVPPGHATSRAQLRAVPLGILLHRTGCSSAHRISIRALCCWLTDFTIVGSQLPAKQSCACSSSPPCHTRHVPNKQVRRYACMIIIQWCLVYELGRARHSRR